MVYSHIAGRKVRAFSLDPKFLEQYKGKQPQWGPVGYFVYKRSYALDLPDGGQEEFWQTCQRVVEGVYYTQKSHCRRSGLPWSEPKAQASAQEMFRRMWAFKFSPPGRGLAKMGTDAVGVKGGAILNNPLHKDTPVLTRDHGWVRLGSLAGSPQVTLLSSKKLYGRDHEATTASAVWVDASVSEIEEQPCRRLRLRDNAGFETEIVASENHRWFRRGSVKKDWERVTTLDLREGDHLPLTLPAKMAPVSVFGAQHGFFFGDGTRSNGELHQFGDSVSVLKALFGDLAVPVTHRRDDEAVVRNCPRSWGVLPEVTSDISYLYGFLAGYFAADGYVDQSGSCSLSSSRKEELERVRDLFLAVGVRVNPIRLSSTESNFSESRELWQMSLHTHDLWEAFFLKASHKERWASHGSEPKRKYARVVGIEDAGVQPVLCATVPEYEQFVVSGFVLTSNCAYVSTGRIHEDFAGPFTFLMDMSMLGVGVGADVRGVGKAALRKPSLSQEPFVVEDSREGWVALMKVVLNSLVGKGSYPSVVDFRQVRPRGLPLKTFGGVSSGPNPLRDLMTSATKVLLPAGVSVSFEATVNEDHPEEVGFLRTYMEGDARPDRIRSAQIADIFNLIGKCVVAGGVRRTAEILFGDPDDESFVNLKDPTGLNVLYERRAALEASGAPLSDIESVDREIREHPVASHRWASNNSVFGEIGMDYADVASRIALNGEPGVFWLKNAQAYSRMIDPPDYKDEKALGCNPCFAGDTLIAVADGRGAVPIRQLVEEGEDVPVYSVNSEGMVEIKVARNPRLTRDLSPLVEITLDDGSVLRVTPDHKMRLLDGTSCVAQAVQPGDSLPRFTKRSEAVKKGGPRYLRVNTNTLDSTKDKVFEHRMVARFCDPETWARVYDEAKQSGWVQGGLVVHHKDYNPKNNAPQNLEILTFREHASLHGSSDFVGEKNPMWGRKHSDETRGLIGSKTRERCADPDFLAKLAASHQAAERAEASERMSEQRQAELLTYYKDQEAKTDLDTVWMEGRLHAVKVCETCQEEFVVPWGVRGQCYCSRVCLNKAESHIQARKQGQVVAFAERQQQTLHDQVRVYKDLSDSLGRDPLRKEWESRCRQEGVAHRFRQEGTTKNPFALSGFGHLQRVVPGYNHRVLSVRFVEGQEPVYNLSVEDNHTVGVVTRHDPETGTCDGIFAFQCGEQTLEPWELCTLVETYPAHHDSFEDFQRTLKYAYLYGKTVTLILTHDPRTNAVMNRNRRIGCSMSGIRQAITKVGRREFLSWCDRGYQYIQKLDKVYSDWLGIPRSIKTTSVKPSGSISLLCSATPGIHLPHSEFYIRNIRVSATSPFVQAARDAGHPVEKDVVAPDTYVISFPVREQHFSKSKNDVSIWEQMSLASDLQRYWADNQVSCTVSFRPEEAGDIETCLEVFEDRMKAVSMLPLSDHGYLQAPYIEITEEQYLEMAGRIREMDLSGASRELEEKFCDGETCTVPSR
jgi:hypothetical protein